MTVDVDANSDSEQVSLPLTMTAPSSTSAISVTLGCRQSVALAAGASATATTLLLVALLKNVELRSEHAMQRKLDALATGMLEAIRDEGADADAMLQRAIRIDEKV